ncbi:MAG: glycogen debranching protein GlgX [Pseudomonadota bacterium]
MTYQITAGRSAPMGAVADAEGVNFAVFSANATQIDLCLFSADGAREVARLPLPARSGDIWHGRVEGLRPGSLYGLRAHGPFAPEAGHRFNPHKLLLDPYARQTKGGFDDHTALLGYKKAAKTEDLTLNESDSAPYMPRAVVQAPDEQTRMTCHPDHPWDKTVIYEAHVKGLTARHPGVPQAFRGTYEGVASDAVIDHLLALGVTAIELLPVQGFLNDSFLLERGLTNYWGYNTANFFAPEPRYFGPAGQSGFRQMVQRLHSAGIEVILDVVYNHTAEGDQRGPTLNFRGLDNASYYRLQSDNPRYYINDTGTGNTVNVAHPNVLRLVLDSLRYWVEFMGIDGFRFDLATTLGREAHGFDPTGGFFDALRQDPTLARTKLIAEPWDIGPGGYQLGGYPPEFAEWNDAYRDTVRRFWKGDVHSAQELGARILGSADFFDRAGRNPHASINLISAHDGFTLADVTAYNQRHNEANGEDNKDGHGTNHSDNCGVEGPTSDAAVLAKRKRRQRNMLATLVFSQGTPMLLAGDEVGNSQSGNNNAYCQDNAISWIDWSNADWALSGFLGELLAFRRAHPSLRQDRFLHAKLRDEDALPDVTWRDLSKGDAPPDWDNPELSELMVVLRGSAEAPAFARTDDVVLVAINRRADATRLALPTARDGYSWAVGIDTSADEQRLRVVSGTSVKVPANSVLALAEITQGLTV